MLWIGTSWKMNGTRAFAHDYARTLAAANIAQFRNVKPFVIPSFTAIDVVVSDLAGTGILVGAQNAHWEQSGAWTGEVSMGQVKDAGASIVEIGHSERREFFNETDRTVNLKVKAALDCGLIPLVCIGEPAEVYEKGNAREFLEDQAEAALDGIDDVSGVILAYEPIWAIGVGGRSPERNDLEPVFCRLNERFGSRVHKLLYGGSVTPDNSESILSIPGVGGLFIGRSAWTVRGYLTNLKLANEFGELRQPFA